MLSAVSGPNRIVKLSMDNKKDIVFLNIAKALGITCIVLGHARFPEQIWRFVSYFHVPIFFFVSGYLYRDKYSSRPFSLIKNRLQTLYVPFIKYEIFFLLLHNIFLEIGIYGTGSPINGNPVEYYSLRDYLKNLGSILLFGANEPGIWGFWFIQSLFTVNILYVSLRWMKGKFSWFGEDKVFLIVVCIFLTGMMLSENSINLPRSLVTSLICLIFFHFGFLYQTHENSIPMNMTGFLSCTLMLLMSVLIYGDHLGVANHVYVRFPYFLMNAMCGIYMVIYFSKIVQSNRIAPVIDFVGRNSYHILALHIISFKLISMLQIKLYGYPADFLSRYPVINPDNGWWVLYAAAGISVPVAIRFLYGNLAAAYTEAKA